jgi:hypothetical protein
MSRTATPRPGVHNHREHKRARPVVRHLEFGVRSLQKDVRPFLYSAAYVKATAETDMDADDVKGQLVKCERLADTYCKQFVGEYLQAYTTNSKSGEQYLAAKAAEKKADLDKWHTKLTNERQSEEARERHLKIAGAILQTVRTVGFISAKALTFMAPGAGNALDLAYTGTEIYVDSSRQPVLLVVEKEAKKQAWDKARETAAEKASEHLADHIEHQALETWTKTASKTPWKLAQPTSKLVKSLGHVQTVKLLGKTVGWAFIVRDVKESLHETYKAWEEALPEGPQHESRHGYHSVGREPVW